MLDKWSEMHSKGQCVNMGHLFRSISKSDIHSIKKKKQQQHKSELSNKSSNIKDTSAESPLEFDRFLFL